MTPSVLTKVGFCIGISVTALGCGDHGLKIHEQPPTASLLDPGDNDSFVEGMPVAFRVQLDDNDDGVPSLDVAWRSDSLGTLRGESSLADNIQTFVTTDLSLGLHLVTVTATDPDGGVDEDDVQISVVKNSTPLITIDSPADGSVYGDDDDIVIIVETQDGEEDAEALTLRWTVDETIDLAAPAAPESSGLGMHTLSGLTVGSHSIEVSVSDSMGQQSSAQLSVRVVALDGDGDGSSTSELGGEDCDDTNPEIVPGADEVCDGVDNDCDGLVDAEDSDITDAISGHPDNDGDGYGDQTVTLITCDLADLSDIEGDCNDADDSVHPGAMETCGDGLDNDCDGSSGACAWTGDISVSTANFAAYGEGEGDRLATSMASGDLNNDGQDDLIVASATSDSGATDGGMVYVIPGPLLDTIGGVDTHATTTVSGISTNGLSGSAVTSTDLDSDGASDLIIAAPGVQVGSDSSAGEVYIFFGDIDGELTTADSDVTISGNVEDQGLGQSMDAGGDIDGDGLPDLILGAPTDGSMEENAGAVFIFTGSADGLSDALSVDDRDSQLASNQESMEFGFAVQFVGDTNGDGMDDLLIGAPGSTEHGVGTGAAFLILGHTTSFSSGASRLHSTSSATYHGAVARDEAGYALTGLNDIDGDGYTEFAVGAPDNDTSAYKGGAVYLMIEPERTGVHELSEMADIAFYGVENRGRIGEAIAGNNDLDNDGVLDLIFSNHLDYGKTHLIYGPLDELSGGDIGGDDSVHDGTFIGDVYASQAGAVLLGGSDWTGDGIKDLAVAAPALPRSDGTSESGGVYVFFGRGM